MAKEQWPDWDVYVQGRCRCVYCGMDGAGSFQVWRQLRIDHLIPKGAGGEDSAANKVVCCVDCNFKKGQFNPRGKAFPGATWASPPDPAIRLRLIEAVKEQIQPKLVEEERDYRTMIEEITAAMHA